MIKQDFKDEVENFPEYMHYFAIEEFGDFIFHMNHEIYHDRIESTDEIQKDIQNVSEMQQYVVSKLTKFGVDPISNDKENGSYWKWFRFWKKWHKETLTKKEWREVDERLQQKLSIDEYLPKNKWND